MSIDSLHVSVPDDQIHVPKGFVNAGRSQYLVKDEQLGVRWYDITQFPSTLGMVDATDAPPTEADQDVYILSGTPHTDWDGASDGDVVRYDSAFDRWFSSPPVAGQRAYDTVRTGYWTYGTQWIGEFNVSRAFSSVEILALYSSPITFISKLFGTAIIEVDQASVDFVYGTSYATNLILQIINTSADIAHYTSSGVLGTTLNQHTKFSRESDAPTETQIMANEDVLVNVAVGNPTAGTGTMTIYATYRIYNV